MLRARPAAPGRSRAHHGRGEGAQTAAPGGPSPGPLREEERSEVRVGRGKGPERTREEGEASRGRTWPAGVEEDRPRGEKAPDPRLRRTAGSDGMTGTKPPSSRGSRSSHSQSTSGSRKYATASEEPTPALAVVVSVAGGGPGCRRAAPASRARADQ